MKLGSKKGGPCICWKLKAQGSDDVLKLGGGVESFSLNIFILGNWAFFGSLETSQVTSLFIVLSQAWVKNQHFLVIRKLCNIWTYNPLVNWFIGFRTNCLSVHVDGASHMVSIWACLQKKSWSTRFHLALYQPKFLEKFSFIFLRPLMTSLRRVCNYSSACSL